MKTKCLVAVILILHLFNHSSAQLKVKCAGKKYLIPEFRQDSTKKSFTEIQFEKLNILTPIQNSNYEIELRGYYEVVNPFMGSVVIVKGNSKMIFAEVYYYHVQRDMADTIPPKDSKIVRWAKRNVYYSIKRLALSDTLLTRLIKNRLFSQADVHVLSDSLKKKNVTVERSRAMDPYAMKFELKVNHLYRSFYCDPFVWSANKSIDVLIPEKTLFDLFNNLYKKSGQNLNHLFP